MPVRVPSSFSRLAGVCAIGVVFATSSARAEGARLEYRLGPGDVLQVTVLGQPELSGKFRVGPEGSLSYPLVGTIPVADRTSSEVTADLAALLQQRVPIRGAPTVEIVEFAPVFVAGEVERPGQYAFRPGMVALELLALAGGERRMLATLETRALQLLTAEQTLANRRLTLFASKVQKARLEAEIAGRDFKPDVATLSSGAAIDRAEAERLASKEVDLFAIRRKTLMNQIASLRDQRASYDREIATLRASDKLHEGELALLEQETANAQRLLDRELGLLPTLLGLKRQLSSTRRDALEIQSFLARAQQHQIEIDQKIQELEDQQKKDNVIALRELELTAAQSLRGLQTDMLSIAEIRGQLDRDPSTPTRVSYRVARMVNGAYADVEVDDFTRLAPRDILRAVRSAPGRGEALMQSAQGAFESEPTPRSPASEGKSP